MRSSAGPPEPGGPALVAAPPALPARSRWFASGGVFVGLEAAWLFAPWAAPWRETPWLTAGVTLLLTAFALVTAATAVALFRRGGHREALLLACWRDRVLAARLGATPTPRHEASRCLQRLLGRHDPLLHDLVASLTVPLNGRTPGPAAARRALGYPLGARWRLSRALTRRHRRRPRAGRYALLVVAAGEAHAVTVRADCAAAAERDATALLFARDTLLPPVSHWSLHRLPDPPRRFRTYSEPELLDELQRHP